MKLSHVLFQQGWVLHDTRASNDWAKVVDYVVVLISHQSKEGIGLFNLFINNTMFYYFLQEIYKTFSFYQRRIKWTKKAAAK